MTPPPPTRAMTPAPPSRPTPPPSPEPARAVAPDVVAYGIRRAMELLRRLPPGERGVLLDVVKMTLESVNVSVEDIVDDATRREGEIERRMEVLHSELAQYEEEVVVRWDEIKRLEGEKEEIAHVKSQLTDQHETTRPLEVVKAPSNDESEGDDNLDHVLTTLKVT